ncbi:MULTISPECIES: uroporphyrinogen-III synthase [Cobetia]|nr:MULTISPECIES: uroporphyrinogen-III synthase [Cobetia]
MAMPVASGAEQSHTAAVQTALTNGAMAKPPACRPEVLTTRPGSRGAVLDAMLTEAGCRVECLELMALEPLPATQAMRQAIIDADLFQGVVVISPQAASCLAEWLEDWWPQLPQGINFYAVGAATAEVLHARLGVRVRVPPRVTRGEHAEADAPVGTTSEALLSLPSLQHLEGQRWLLAAGEGGRPLLGDTLEARGAQLTRIELYRRLPLVLSPQQAGRLAAGAYDAMVVTSNELLETVLTSVTTRSLYQPLIVSSNRLATLAYAHGFERVTVAEDASPGALTQAVLRACTPAT